jgi:hypothetical protein
VPIFGIPGFGVDIGIKIRTIDDFIRELEDGNEIDETVSELEDEDEE